jgi:hypothetical protein
VKHVRKFGDVTIRFKTEKDRTKGLYELYNSNIRSGCVGDNEYVVAQEHLKLFDSKEISYKIIKQ